MQLDEIESFDKITIQCHDNPDADAIASGFGLYLYFKSKRREVRLIYSGRFQIQKPNLKLMIEELQIPIVHYPVSEQMVEGILITVDCQYGAGNVTTFNVENVAIFDHHQIEIDNVMLSVINSNLGSCSTLIWSYLKKHNFPVNENVNLATALYYGLYSDTNQFTEIYNPLDLDMRDDLQINKSQITLFRNSNLTLEELGIAGVAMLRCIYNEDYHYAIVKAQPCDPNILGLISDFLLQVDGVNCCVVYNTLPDGYKISIRSCSKEVQANELAKYLTRDFGSGGGHFEKAGGFISLKLYEKRYPMLHSEAYFSNCMDEYFESFDIVYMQDYQFVENTWEHFREREAILGVVNFSKLLPKGTSVIIRTLEGDIEVVVSENSYIMIGARGEVFQIGKKKFEEKYAVIEDAFHMEMDYTPTVKDKNTGKSVELLQYAKACVTVGGTCIYAKKLQKSIKIFTTHESERYISGYAGDYAVVPVNNINDIKIIKKDNFDNLYEKDLV